MSDGIGLSTVLSCFSVGEPVMGVVPSGWVSAGVNRYQDYFAANQLSWRPGLANFRGDSLRYFAHTDVAEVVKTMREWNMHLPTPPTVPGGVYMISQYREMLKWLEEAKILSGYYDWPAFWLKAGVEFFDTKVSSEPVVRVMTQEGDFAYMMRLRDELRGMEILFRINEIMKSLTPNYDGYHGFHAPMIYAEMKPDLEWILGMRNKSWFIAYAKQNIRFGMNQIGFATQEDTSMVSMKAAFGAPYVLSPDGEPFLFWRTRFNVLFPLSIFQFTRDNFADPGNLEQIIS